ncbi:MAG: tetratricopeptide repeat protein [Opitutales bacterium]
MEPVKTHAALSPDAGALRDYWTNPAFVRSFMGSYGVDAEISPRISPSEQALFSEIVPLMAEKPHEAISRLRKNIIPDSSAAMEYTIGNLHFQEGELDEAVTAYVEALVKFPNFYRAHKNLAIVLIRKDDTNGALPHILKALELKPGDGTLYGLLGLCRLREGRTGTALAAYDQALLLDPDGRDWQRGRLSCLMKLERYSEAAQMLDGMIASEPGRSEYWLWQANAYVGENEAAKAMRNLEIVKDMGQASGQSLMLLADLYLNTGLLDAALENYTEAMERGPVMPGRILHAADALLQGGDCKKAEHLVSNLEKLKLASPDCLMLMLVDAKIKLANGDAIAAQKLLEDLVDRDPMNGRAHLLLGNLYTKKGQTDLAAMEYGYAAKDDHTRLQALLENSRLCVNQRDYAGAEKLLEDYLALNERADVADYLAQVKQAASVRNL